MRQKSSVPQAAESVSQALMSDRCKHYGRDHEKNSFRSTPTSCDGRANGAARSVDEVATKLKQPVQKIQAWENQDSGERPTVGQARSLAAFYERHFLKFFRNTRPPVPEPKLVPDFRLPRDTKKLNPEQERDLKSIQSWAEAHRDNALDLYSEIGEEPPVLSESIYSSVRSDADAAAVRARRNLTFVDAARKKPHLSELAL